VFLHAEKSGSKKAKYGGKLSKKHILPTSRVMHLTLEKHIVGDERTSFRKRHPKPFA